MSLGENELVEVASHIDDVNTFKNFSKVSQLTKKISQLHLSRMHYEFDDLTRLSWVSYKYMILLCRLFAKTHSVMKQCFPSYCYPWLYARDFIINTYFNHVKKGIKAYAQRPDIDIIETNGEYSIRLHNIAKIINVIENNSVRIVVADAINVRSYNLRYDHETNREICSGSMLIGHIRTIVFARKTNDNCPIINSSPEIMDY